MKSEIRNVSFAKAFLITRYKNWAALDNATEKSDMITKQMGNTVAGESKAQVERASIRRVLGSSTMQVLDLK